MTFLYYNNENSAASNVKTASRIVRIIEIFAHEKKPLSLTELARHLDAPISSCAALIKTLGRQGYLYETGQRQGYYPTGRLLAMAQRISSADPILEKVYPAMYALRETTSETIVFAKLGVENKVIYLQVLDSPHPIRYVALPGAQRVIHTTALGRALLSTLTSVERERILLSSLSALPSSASLSINEIERNIEVSLTRGWFANVGDSMPEVASVAWPLKIAERSYAISISGPHYRIESGIDIYARNLRFACTSIEQTLQAVAAPRMT